MSTQNINAGRYSSRQVESGLSVPEHDFISINNDGNGNPTTVVYRAGGPSGQIVSTVNMTYDGNGYLTTVTRIQ
jgi:YD repeat-containing protein